MSWREDCFKQGECVCTETCMMFVKPAKDLCPYCNEDFTGKGYIFKVEHNCPEWAEYMRSCKFDLDEFFKP